MVVGGRVMLAGAGVTMSFTKVFDIVNRFKFFVHLYNILSNDCVYVIMYCIVLTFSAKYGYLTIVL